MNVRECVDWLSDAGGRRKRDAGTVCMQDMGEHIT
jgi:hypothetical protein